MSNLVLSVALVGSGFVSSACGYRVPMPAELQGEEPESEAKEEEEEEGDDAVGDEVEYSSPSSAEAPSDDPLPPKRSPDEVDMYETVPIGGGVDPDEDKRRAGSLLDDELADRDPDDGLDGDGGELADPAEYQ